MEQLLTPAAVMEAKRLYEERDGRGRRLHSIMGLAAEFGVGETTMYRALKRRGAYVGVRELPTQEDAAASEARFRAQHPELFGGVAVEAASPTNGFAVPGLPVSEEIQAKANELRGGPRDAGYED